ncbi:YeeE/YedE thiosulfate transporter family protein [Pseudaquabacterium terrae]|nr:YeeE/YedE thiosulfate transporter family protein [Aquabacterium terrae]
MDAPAIAAGAAAAACAALMGLAIQRGATCTVAAVDEWLRERRATRLAALAEAALWVGAGLLIARAFGVLPRLPAGYPLSGWTFAGAALLGLGAFVNRACVFGAIARFGNGEWAYLATPLGFFAGCLSVEPLFAAMAPAPLAETPPALAAPASGLLALAGAWALWRVVAALRHAHQRAAAPARQRLGGAWTPRAATTVIGLSFLALLLLAGPWAYTDLLAELAHGMAHSVPARVGLFACLLAGALAGGAGRWRRGWPPARDWARCVAGGLLMGWGSLLIPGGNDGLILAGMPLGWPYAWAAFAMMVLVIAVAMAARQRWAAAASPETASRAAPPGAA